MRTSVTSNRTAFFVALLLAILSPAGYAGEGEMLFLLDAAAPLPPESSIWDRITVAGTELVIASCPGAAPSADAVRGAIEPCGPGEMLYIVTSPGPADLFEIGIRGTIVVGDSHAALVRATAGEAEEIAARGLELRAVLPPPLRGGSARKGPARAAKNSFLAWDSRIQEIVDAVTIEEMEIFIGNLTGLNSVTIGGAPYTIETRNSYQTTPIGNATQYCYEYFQGLGLSAAYDGYTWGSYAWRNVVAEQPGTVSPDGIYLVCTHLDDMPSGATAPGADDNASGSAAVLLAASILNGYAFENTIRYVLFTGEEQGLIGSYYYVQDCVAAGDEILGAVNLDMIAYDGNADNRIDLHCGTIAASGTMGDLFISTIGDYSLSLVPQKITTGAATASDHSRFWNAGYPAILGIEDYSGSPNDFNPYYHTVNDTRAHCVLPYAAEFTRAAVGTLAQLGGLVSETPTPTPTPSPTPTPPWGIVNFQPPSVTPLPWYWPDDGSLFGTWGAYGWL
ncbi:MAG: M28 family peptidase [Chlamydiota bacterium]